MAVEVPSPVLAERASSRASERYAFVSTKQVMDLLDERGWAVESATAAKVRNPEREGFQRHMLKFVPKDPENEIRVGGSLAQILLFNSHDLSSSITARGGFYRFACANGLVVGSDISKICVPHKGSAEDITSAVLGIADRLPELAQTVHNWEAVKLQDYEQRRFAEEALAVRWPERAPITVSDALRVRRDADLGDDLWTVFNRVQENMIKGGMMGVSTDGKVRVIRSVEGMASGLGVNVGLWNVAERWAA